MKFRVGDIVRHVNGVKEFLVYDRNPKQGVYALKEDGSKVIHYYAGCHVDRMYKHVGFENGRPFTDTPVKQPEVVEEYEIDCWGATVWTHVDSYAFPRGSDVRYTGRTRKVVVQ